tara:strand:+ start:1397 stop:2371 length:975 start_codon:yes stop_codon:yes gene_type:complete
MLIESVNQEANKEENIEMVRQRGNGRSISGIIFLDKTAGQSSNYALQRVKRLLNAKKAGHTGSLDPLATGVLPLCFGEATKVSQFLLEADKRYLVKVVLGKRTDSGDSDGATLKIQRQINVESETLVAALNKFEGVIQQLPPMYSALKYKGVPLYKFARKGVNIERKLRSVTVRKIVLLNFEDNIVDIDVTCSKGTYIRTLADDLGEELGCGAHVSQLRRIQAGRFTIDGCRKLDDLEAIKESGGLGALDELLIPMDQAITEMPQVLLERKTAKQIKSGQAVFLDEVPENGLVRLYEGKSFIGIGVINIEGEVAPRRLVAAENV